MPLISSVSLVPLLGSGIFSLEFLLLAFSFLLCVHCPLNKK